MTLPTSLLTLAAAVALTVAGLPVRAQATPWQKNHPRRAEVNQRLNNQNRRIRQGVQSGKLSPDQAKALHQEDHSIRQEERQDAAQQGGHITRQQKRALNRQENQVSRQIRQQKQGQNPPPAAPAQ